MKRARKQNHPKFQGTSSSDQLVKLARILKDKGVISEEEFDLIFG